MKLKMYVISLSLFLLFFTGCDFQSSGKQVIDKDTIETIDETADESDDQTADESDDHTVTDSDSSEKIDETIKVDEDEDETTLPDIDSGETTSVTIATWNVYRFFDTVCQSGLCGSGDYEELPSISEFNAQADDIVEGIKKINADVVLLQEVESEACMEALASRLGYTENQWIIVEDRYRQGDVYTAIMTKGTIVAREQYPETDSGYFSRPLLQATINYGGEFIVFAAHFKSKSNDNPELRLAEAEKAHDIVTTVALANENMLVVLGGDLNDTPDSPPLDALLDAGNFLRTAEELGHPGDATIWYASRAETIDHLLMSTRTAGTFLPGSAEIVKNSPTWYGLQNSDHAAVKSGFSF